MALDASIFGALGTRPKSAADYAADQAAIQQNALNLQMGRQKLDAYQQDQAEKQSLRNLLSGQTLDLSNPADQAKLYSAAPTMAPGLLKTHQEGLTSAALASKDRGAAAESAQKVTDAAFAHYQNVLGTLQTPDQAAQFVAASYQDPIIGPILQKTGDLKTSLAHLQEIFAQPDGFQQWQAKASIGMKNLANMAKVQEVNSGGKTTTQLVQPATGQVQTLASIQNTQSPDNAANNATSRANNAANIQKDFKVAGLDANGNFVGGADGASPLKGLVDAIGTYQSPESIALSRVPPAMKSQVLAQVRQQYPDYDPMTYTERQAGIHSFAPNGNNGKTVQALNVSVDHLQKFRELATALDNGDNQTMNKIGNAISSWTGSAAPTNFEAAKNIVMDEVTKGVIGAAGGQGDREKMAEVVSKANSPKQLAGALDTITNLMGGRLDGVQKSYESSTGKKDFSSKYLTPQAKAALERANGAPAGAAAIPAAPSGFKITHIDGKSQ